MKHLNMKLSEFAKKYESRAKCAEALGVSYHHLANLLALDNDVLELKSGRFILTNKYNKYFN